MRTKVCCVSPETALQILDIRLDQQRTVPVHLCGMVQAVSPVTQVKDSQLFLIKFLPGVDIIIKKKELLQWQEFLKPNEENVITGLRPTTLQKGGTKQSRVYTVAGSSQLFSREAVAVDLISLQQWLASNKLSFSTANPSPSVTLPNKLFSYQGTVTQVLDRLLGVFELDREVRLHVGQVPAIPSFSSLQVGETITVHNSHHRKNQQARQTPKLILYGCMLCSITRQKADTTASSKVKSPSPVLQKYLYLYELSQQKLDFLYTLRCTLYKQFKQMFDNRGIEKIFTRILGMEGLSWKQSTQGPYRNLLDEFLHSPHTCSVSSETSEQTLPEYVTVEEVLSRLESPPQESPGQWLCSRQNVKDQVLLGVLSTCDKTGQCVLYDATASVPFITCCMHGDAKCNCPENHACNEQCQCGNLSKYDPFPCNKLHICCRGKLVAFRRFLAVCETVSDNSVSPAAHDTKSGKCLKYLCVNLKETVVFGDKSIYEKWSGDKVLEIRQKPADKQELKVTNKAKTDRVVTNKAKTDRAVTNKAKTDRAVTSRSASNDGNLGNVMEREDTLPSLGEGCVPVLHRHVQEDGSSRFCRSTTCAVAVRKNGESSLSGTSDAQANILDVIGENDREKAVTELLDNTFEAEISDLTLNVKPVRKQVLGNCTVTEVDSTRCKTYHNGSSNTHDKTGIIKQCEQMPSAEDNMMELCKTSVDHIGVVEQAQLDDLSAAPPLVSELLRGQDKVCGTEQAQIIVNHSCVTVCVVNKEALRQDRQTTTSVALMTCVDCVLLRSDRQRQVKVMFQNPSLRWYPCLYPGHVYTLTSPHGGPPLLTPHASNKKLRHAVERSNLQSCRVIHDEVGVEEMFGAKEDSDCDTVSASAVVQERVLGKHFSDVEGVVVRRTLVRRDQQHSDVQSRPNVQDHSRSDSFNTRIDVQEATGGQTVQVYMDHGNLFLPLGLIPGAAVNFKRLECITSRSGNLYYRFAYLTSVDVKCVANPAERSVQCEPQTCRASARCQLVELWKEQKPGLVFQCVCDVSQIPKLSLKCVCDYCGSTIVKSRCSNAACFGGESAEMLARASAIVDDGTSVAMVSMSGSCVQNLLLLSSDQWSALEQETKATGEVFVQQAKQPNLSTPMEQLAYTLCDNRMVKRPWLMTLRRRKTGKETLDLNKIELDEFAQKTFDIGSSRITTHCLPFLQLDCVAIEKFNPTVASTYYLANT